MSKGVVSQRPFTRKRRKQSLKKVLNRSGISVPDIKISAKIKNLISRGLCFIVVIVCGILFLIKSLFFQAKHTISQVAFSDSTLATYQDVDLFNFISNEVKGQNYFVITSNKDSLLSKIQKGFTIRQLGGETITQAFPFVGDIEFYLDEEIHDTSSSLANELIITSIKLSEDLPITQSGTISTNFPLKYANKLGDKQGGTLGVQLLYYEPKLLIKLNDKEFAVRDEDTYIELKEGMLLGIRDPEEEPLFTIETPMYLSGVNNINGFFFEISLDNFLQIIQLAKDKFPDMQRFVYLAGSRRIVIFTPDNKMLFFNFPEGTDILEQWNIQINKYDLLREKFSNFSSLKTIDLGSLENNKVIIRK